MPVRVFISHSSKDREAVASLAEAIRARGHDPWLDVWEIRDGADFVARIDQGLDESTVGILVFSKHAAESPWVRAETSYLTWARIREGMVLIPVTLGDGAKLPPLLRPLIHRRIEEVDAIVDAIENRGTPGPQTPIGAAARVERVTVHLERSDGSSGLVRVQIGDLDYVDAPFSSIPNDVLRGRTEFLQGFRTGPLRSPETAARVQVESSLAQLGRALGAFVFPGDSGAAIADLVDGSQPLGTLIEFCFRSNDPELLGLPFEAVRLPDGTLLSTRSAVSLMRSPIGSTQPKVPPLAGPLKVLVAVAAPDEGPGTTVLDQERELQNILDATDFARVNENAQVRILEVGHPKSIAEALERDAYHVLHLSGHGLRARPEILRTLSFVTDGAEFEHETTVLEMETEDGVAVYSTAEMLLEPIRNTGRGLPLVFLSCCHGAVSAAQTASLAEDLLRAGVPCVIAMQAAVTDYYASELARAFYQHLSQDGERLLPSLALAQARRDLEKDRQLALQRPNPELHHIQPEYATATVYVAGDVEAPLADFGLDRVPLRARPVHHMSGPVPQLRADDLIGRKRLLRETLRVLRADSPASPGVVLTGIGGVGKSALAGRAMRRLVESGYIVAAHVGRWDLPSIVRSVVSALATEERDPLPQIRRDLANPELDDQTRLSLLAKLLAEERVILVLDDFEQNLARDATRFLDESTLAIVGGLLRASNRGRILFTCRTPIPGLDAFLHRIPVGPLTLAETRKLLRRLDKLSLRAPEELIRVLRVIGGHPRMLEFLDGLLRGGVGRLPLVTERLRKEQEAAGVAANREVADLDDQVQQTILLGARDVFLEELVAIARAEGIDEPLFQLAVSNLPVGPGGLAHMLADGPEGDEAEAERAMERLEELSLVFRSENGAAWVHRWTAEGLRSLDSDEAHAQRASRAGRYRMWRVENESHAIEDGLEGMRNHLAAGDFDSATAVAFGLLGALQRFQQSTAVISVASEILETLPDAHQNFNWIADAEASALLALGLTPLAFSRYESLLARHQNLAQAEPDRADYQRDLSVSLNKMGDLYAALGQGEKARDAFLAALQIREKLAQAEPDRADYQRDLSVSLNKMGDLYAALGQGEKARDAFLASLQIREKLAQAEPDRADYQRDLSVVFTALGVLARAEEKRDEERDWLEKDLEIARRLVGMETGRADYQVDLAISLMNTAQSGVEDAKALLGEAVQILEALEGQGRFAPDEAPRLELARQLLAKS